MSYNYNNKKSLYIEITLTNNCNCKCTYCFEGEHTQRCEKRNIDVEQK
jgi:molybdenum cofactor biosynthesis enzyme MoaA